MQKVGRTTTIEKRGGVTTPLRLFATVWETRGLVKTKIAETEVVVEHGIIKIKDKG